MDQKDVFKIKAAAGGLLIFLTILVFLRNLVGAMVVYLIIAFIMIIVSIFAFFYIRDYFNNLFRGI